MNILMENIEDQHIMNVIYIVKKPKRIPIVFHNGSNYDNHLFIRSLAEYGKNKKIDVI